MSVITLILIFILSFISCSVYIFVCWKTIWHLNLSRQRFIRELFNSDRFYQCDVIRKQFLSCIYVQNSLSIHLISDIISSLQIFFLPIQVYTMEINQSLEIKQSSLIIKHFSPLRMGTGINTMKNSKAKSYQQNVPKRATRCCLPKQATEILKAWLLKNFIDPYPSEEEKLKLAEETKLKLEQVNNWLINARRRLLPSICLKYGLDHSKCKIAKRGGNRGFVVDKLKSMKRDPYSDLSKPNSQSSISSVATETNKDPSSNFTYKLILKVPDSPEHPTMLDYLADVMLVNEELEKSPNNEGLSRMEFLCRRGLGERMHLCSQ
ncbi:hypothetical protein JTE90_000737 [Oedothorax gibbosus]|uniref:Homeobox domain-containing protein n=1 Tax=Oedothorax gibbosus TaxID=931172 RepID=A0AAV6UPW4_9ARAC|nr:hypothetical protein JTE90_000737 [Oedothorax gibbosus]